VPANLKNPRFKPLRYFYAPDVVLPALLDKSSNRDLHAEFSELATRYTIEAMGQIGRVGLARLQPFVPGLKELETPVEAMVNLTVKSLAMNLRAGECGCWRAVKAVKGEPGENSNPAKAKRKCEANHRIAGYQVFRDDRHQPFWEFLHAAILGSKMLKIEEDKPRIPLTEGLKSGCMWFHSASGNEEGEGVLVGLHRYFRVRRVARHYCSACEQESYQKCDKEECVKHSAKRSIRLLNSRLVLPKLWYCEADGFAVAAEGSVDSEEPPQCTICKTPMSLFEGYHEPFPVWSCKLNQGKKREDHYFTGEKGTLCPVCGSRHTSRAVNSSVLQVRFEPKKVSLETARGGKPLDPRAEDGASDPLADASPDWELPYSPFGDEGEESASDERGDPSLHIVEGDFQSNEDFAHPKGRAEENDRAQVKVAPPKREEIAPSVMEDENARSSEVELRMDYASGLREFAAGETGWASLLNAFAQDPFKDQEAVNVEALNVFERWGEWKLTPNRNEEPKDWWRVTDRLEAHAYTIFSNDEAEKLVDTLPDCDEGFRMIMRGAFGDRLLRFLCHYFAPEEAVDSPVKVVDAPDEEDTDHNET